MSSVDLGIAGPMDVAGDDGSDVHIGEELF